MVASPALAYGASHLGVATVEEGAALRAAGIDAPILVLGPIDRSEIACALKLKLSLSIAHPEVAVSVAQLAAELNLPTKPSVHLKVDTGMRRYGVAVDEAVALGRMLRDLSALSFDGVFTHFACADELDERPTLEQANAFERVLVKLRTEGITPPLVHAANSAATMRFRPYHYDMVRIGIAMYGLPPSPETPLPAGVRPVLSIRSRVARVIELSPGDGVSYGHTYRAKDRERAALIPIGYGDGYRRGLSSRAWMGLSGKAAPVRGRVCMDQTVIGVPEDLIVDVGEEVVVAGAPESGAPDLATLAELTGTIPYELATGMAARVPRWYVRSGRTVAIEDWQGLRLIAEGTDG
jgi:alanine racemase